MKKSIWYVLAILVLLIAAIVASVSRLDLGGKDKDTPPSESLAPVESAAPEPTPTPESTPTPEPEVEETPEPVNTPEPTPASTTTPIPNAGTLVSQGSFASDTGTALNIEVAWTVRTQGDTASLDIDISLNSYSLQTDALPGSIALTVNGTSYTLGSPAVHYDGKTEISTPMASKSVSIPLDADGKASADIAVTWNYRGSYGGKELDTISATGTASIG
jgi:hypothetical protein